MAHTLQMLSPSAQTESPLCAQPRVRLYVTGVHDGSSTAKLKHRVNIFLQLPKLMVWPLYMIYLSK